MRIDRYVHDERLTRGAAFVLFAVTAIHAGGIGTLLTARAPEVTAEAARIFQVSLERLPPPPLPRIDQSDAADDPVEQPKAAPRKTRPVPILVDTPTENPVPPDTQVKQYEIGDELLEGERGPPSPAGEVDGTAPDPVREPLTIRKVSLLHMKPVATPHSTNRH